MKITIELTDSASDTDSNSISISKALNKITESAALEEPVDAGVPAVSMTLSSSQMQSPSKEQANDSGAPTFAHPMINGMMAELVMEEINYGVAPFPSEPLSLAGDMNLVDIGQPPEFLLNTLGEAKNRSAAENRNEEKE
jgi:hypothetical protein